MWLQILMFSFFFPSVGFWSYLCWDFCYPGGFVICVVLLYVVWVFALPVWVLLYVWVLFYLCRYFFTCVGFYLPLWVFVLPVWVLWGFNLPEWVGHFRRSSWGSGIQTGSPLVGGSWEGLYIGPATCKIQQHSAQGSRSQHRGQGSKWLKLLLI